MTPKQERFVEEYLTDLNATQAAIRAGYSAKTADVQGPRLLGNVGVAAEIAARQAKRSERTGITQEWLTDELRTSLAIARATEDGATANKSLELLGKLHGLFVDKSEVSFPNVATLSDKELEAQRRKVMKIA